MAGIITTITALFTAALGWFGSVFELITSDPVLPWALLGVGISLLGVMTKFARKMIWGA